MVKLSVIILNYNVRYHLELCLQSVQRALKSIDSEIIVIDNASTDGSVEMLQTNFSKIKTIFNSENIGFAKANNLGVKQALGDYICILNPDTVIPENCFSEILKFAEEKENLGAVGVKLIDGTGNFLPESKRNLPTPKVAIQKMLGIDKNYYANQISKDDTSPIPILVGAFMFMLKNAYDDVGGFDEEYFMYGEDIDLSYRLKQSGYSNYYLGTVSVLHFKGESTIRDKKHSKRFYGAMRIFYKKHFKQNVFLNAIVKSGLFLAEVKGRHNFDRENVEENKLKSVLFSGAEEVLKKIHSVGDITGIEMRNCLSDSNDLLQSQIFFDAGFLEYSEILKTMQLLKNKQNTFKIIPSNCNFSIGSNSSVHKGTVDCFDKIKKSEAK